MIAVGQAVTAFDQRVEAAIERWPAWRGRVLRYGQAAPPVASPVHRAVASDCVRVAIDGEADVFLKIRHADMAADIVPWADAAARTAASIGVAPAVVLAVDGLLGMTFLTEPWRTATAGDLQDRAVLGRVLDAKRQLHRHGPIGHRFDPFDRIAALAAEAAAAAVPVPDDMAQLLDNVRLVRDAIAAAGADLTFCHNDGLASNVMLGAGAVQLVDFDNGGDNDPWFDVGALINEACDFDADRRAAIEHYAGRCEERMFNRCRLYGAVDDVIWGLWGLTRAITSQRSGIEFYKYGSWRLLHARTTLRARDCEAWLRGL